MCSAATSRRASPICGQSTGKISASISFWCSHRARSPARRTATSTLTLADGGTPAEEAAIVKTLAAAFPTVTAIGVKDALTTLDTLIGNLVLALRAASAVTLLAAALVLGGGLAASQRFRIYDAVVLKTYGATRGRLLTAYAIEYFLVGLAAVVVGVGIGTLAAGLVVTRLMDFSFAFVAAPAAAAAAIALIVTLVLGLAG